LGYRRLPPPMPPAASFATPASWAWTFEREETEDTKVLPTKTADRNRHWVKKEYPLGTARTQSERHQGSFRLGIETAIIVTSP
jgi:hypothetical protein